MHVSEKSTTYMAENTDLPRRLTSAGYTHSRPFLPAPDARTDARRLSLPGPPGLDTAEFNRDGGLAYRTGGDGRGSERRREIPGVEADLWPVFPSAGGERRPPWGRAREAASSGADTLPADGTAERVP
mmetsp:Transcript_18541/g.36934  ORF Transcript_18541/g.36934 Transcript_18541/m.36934 type:complete len:128 (+) Transcript_18541:502-885(+)